MLKIACFLLILGAYNCVPAKGANATNSTASNNTSKNENAKEMKENGFSKGTIVASKSEGCPYILTVEEYNDSLDPININEFFKTEVPQQVWVKFSSLRRPSRCADARPVSITEINIRNE
ncbi:hypothetical protein [Aquimarina sediminis]|uniref:hypothetical protein n=1 Tax=Aquimarina sediminis TaxID=2070536 RepID=UPI000FFE9850|nr:hypothetical protein [Aquimarina sediminis]